MDIPEIGLQRDGAIATITLARSARRNALNSAMLERIEQLARGFSSDESTRVVIVRAEGGDFSVGADLADMAGRMSESASLLMRRRQAGLGAQLMRALQEVPQPTICAIQGIATGGAACIASACDFRIGSLDCRVGYGEVKLGINLMWNALPLCVHLVGPARARQMIMSGKLFDATTLERWGFLDEVCAREELDERAGAWAREYAALPPGAVQMIKRSINAVSGALDRAIMHMDADQWLLCTRSEDFREGLSAFLEKRSADFQGN
jgi:enoyl-CoA hydratase/carnithine racemase